MGCISFEIGAQAAHGQRRPAAGGEPHRIDPGQVRVSGKFGLIHEIVQGGLHVLHARPMLQTFLKIVVPRRAVGMVD